MAMTAIAAIVLVTAVISYFTGYGTGLRDGKKRRQNGYSCSCGRMTFKSIKTKSDMTHHRVPPLVCQPIRETIAEEGL